VRELERLDRHPRYPNLPAQGQPLDPLHIALIGRGRLGRALAAALRDARLLVEGPLGRGATGAGSDAVILAVPDGEIPAAARAVAPGPLVGHCSGACGLGVLGGHEAFGLPPLLAVTDAGARFEGAACAIAGSSERSRAVADALARRLGMTPFEVADEDRAAYHAAASIASNFLVTLEGAAERLAATAGVGREHLAPLVRATVDNWVSLGAEKALTGPLARGDEAIVARQREAVVERAPELAPLFDALLDATRRVATDQPLGDEAPSSPPMALATHGVRA
jgi:predicted short-subunit dehydrogenase-like oxidoreductase (DUF2520 family)